MTRPPARDGLGHPARSARRWDRGTRGIGARAFPAHAPIAVARSRSGALPRHVRVSLADPGRVRIPRAERPARASGERPGTSRLGSGKLKSRAGPGAGDAFAPAEGLLGAHGQDGGAEASHLSCRLGEVGCRTEVECASMAPEPGPSSAYKVRDARKRTEPDAIYARVRCIVSPDWSTGFWRLCGVSLVAKFCEKRQQQELCVFWSVCVSITPEEPEHTLRENRRGFGRGGAHWSARSRAW